MSFLDTEPAAIHRLDATGTWARFRVGEPRRLLAMLRELCQQSVPLTLGLAGGANAVAVLWSVDEVQGRLHFSATAAPEVLQQLATTPGLWAAGYLRDVKVQFELNGFTPSFSGPVPTVLAQVPRHLYSMPRRRAVRVRRVDDLSPLVQFRHPLAPEAPLQMRVIDISMTGCALFKPVGGLPLAPGAALRQVEVQLDEESMFFTDLRVQHVTFNAASRQGMRVGCAWAGLPPSASQTLQAWIGRGRRRRDLVSLAFD